MKTSKLRGLLLILLAAPIATASAADSYYTVISARTINNEGTIDATYDFVPGGADGGTKCGSVITTKCELKIEKPNGHKFGTWTCAAGTTYADCVRTYSPALLKVGVKEGQRYRIILENDRTYMRRLTFPWFDVTKGWESCYINAAEIVDGGTHERGNKTIKIQANNAAYVDCSEAVHVRLSAITVQGMKIAKINGIYSTSITMYMNKGNNAIPLELHVYPGEKKPGKHEASAILRMTIL